ncbi:MAG TPA: flavodoxin family protein [Tenuifilaceae bacterium]|nr:flavodoxin family protein [Tenuifilaceae bacterium]HPQ35650.1 flavodoxin family protein [Tenuifilaceae bacterium]HRX10691.1 flavodoxin family protein [Draconibacterium sp.]
MKVTAFVASARKKHTYNATERFLQKLQTFGKIEYEIVSLNDYNLQICRGCKICFEKGEEFCRLKDDRDILIEKMKNSDGIILATPNYSFHVSALMKAFLDRLGYVFHRPEFFGKTFTSIVVQGIYGGDAIVKYLDFVGNGLGFNTIKGCCITTLEPMTKKQENANNKLIDNLTQKFYKELIKKRFPNPSLFKLMVFRMSRTSINRMLDSNFKDYSHFDEKGWFDAEYFYPVKLNPVKKLAGRMFDWLALINTKD